MKRCSRCKEEKVETDFGSHKGRKDGLADYCKVCQRAAGKIAYDKNPRQRGTPEQLRARQYAWRKRNPEKYLATMLRHSAKRLCIPEPTRPRPERCEACGDFPRKRSLVRDHDHFEGAFRGWLCNGCNVALGFLKDNPRRIEGLLAYLRRSE